MGIIKLYKYEIYHCRFSFTMSTKATAVKNFGSLLQWNSISFAKYLPHVVKFRIIDRVIDKCLLLFMSRSPNSST